MNNVGPAQNQARGSQQHHYLDQESSNNDSSSNQQHGVIVYEENAADGFYSHSNATANELATSAQPTVQQQQRVSNQVLNHRSQQQQ